MASLLDDVDKLIQKKVGDISRLEHIKESIEDNKKLYDSDRDYLDSLIEKHLTKTINDEISESNEPQKTSSKSSKNDSQSSDTFCGNCGKPTGEENEFCPKCGSPLRNQTLSTEIPNRNYQRPVEWKSESTTLVLSIILGLLGLQGVGHLYVGKIAKGVGILIGSIILVAVAIALIATGIGAIIGVPLLIGYLVMFIWQIIDSRNLCREYNQYLERYHRPPNW